MISECEISFGYNQFHGELIHLFTSTGIIIASLRFSTILNAKFFVSPYFNRNFGPFTDHSPLTRSRDNDVTSKMEVIRSVVRKYSFSQ